MNNYEDWANIVAKRLKGEAEIIAAIEKEELDDRAATDAFVSAVLEPFLPENFGIGSGRIVDAFDNHSEHLDVIVYNRDFPRIGMNGANSTYLYESVLAVFSIRAKFVRKTLFESLNACASLADLKTNLDTAVLVKLANRNGLRPGPDKTFIHSDPLHTARFELIGRPPAFVFGFSGIKYSYRQLQENLELWIDQRRDAGLETRMSAMPAVIATQGSFAWRNAAPLALSNREMMGIGNDEAPIRLIVLQLLYLLNRRLNVTADGYGLKPNLGAYVSQFAVPKFEVGVGEVTQMAAAKPTDSGAQSESSEARFASAKDHTPAVKATSLEEEAPTLVNEELPALEEEEAQTLINEELPTLEATPDRVEAVDKPAPVSPPAAKQKAASQPAPQKQNKADQSQGGVFDKPSPFASAPAPKKPEPEPAPAKPASAPVASLGSAPIPAKKPVAEVIPPKPPVDFELDTQFDLDSDSSASADLEPKSSEVGDKQAEASPKAEKPAKKSSRKSTDAFITRVKNQLASSEPLSEDQDPYSATIPQ